VKLIQAQADAARTRRDAETQSKVTRLAAESGLYSTTKQAEGRRATALAEAQGIDQARKAMTGDGGAALVELEYAKHLNNIQFTGTPVTRQSTIQQLSVQPTEAEAAVQSAAVPRDGTPAPPPPRTTPAAAPAAAPSPIVRENSPASVAPAPSHGGKQ
jgi:hypothetical protein